jgi:glycosyltransferase involved in cell wall biosynthesis
MHDNAATIVRALESALGQTLAPLEVIVVDDASGDDGPSRVAAIATRDPRVRLERLGSNLGPSTARNLGWHLAHGEWIAFLDADDWWHPRKLEVQVAAMRRHPEWVLSGHRWVATPGSDFASREVAVAGERALSLRSLAMRNRLSTPTVMVRRAVTERFDVRRMHAEDWDLWVRIVAVHGPAGWLDATLTALDKAAVSSRGISAQQSRMHRGELATVAAMRRSGAVGAPAAVAWRLWLRAKRVRRALRTGAGATDDDLVVLAAGA